MGTVETAAQLDTHLGGWNLTLLSSNGLLLQQLGLNLLLDLSQLLLLQLNSLQSLQYDPWTLRGLNQLGGYCHTVHCSSWLGLLNDLSC